jgi:hypothetical protein
VFALLQPQRLEVGDGRRLARAVGARTGQAADAGHTRNACQRASAVGAHGGQKRGECIEERHHVHIDDPSKYRRIGSLRGERAGADAGIGNHDVGRAKFGNKPPGRIIERIPIGDVDGKGPDCGRCQPLGDTREKIMPPRNQREHRLRMAPGIFERECLAQAA